MQRAPGGICRPGTDAMAPLSLTAALDIDVVHQCSRRRWFAFYLNSNRQTPGQRRYSTHDYQVLLLLFRALKF